MRNADSGRTSKRVRRRRAGGQDGDLDELVKLSIDTPRWLREWLEDEADATRHSMASIASEMLEEAVLRQNPKARRA